MYPKSSNRPGTTAAQARFAKVPGHSIERSQFDRSNGRKSTFNAGLLIPVWVEEALPGDTYNVRMSTFCRLATPLFPVLDNLYLDSFFFSVPNRLLWDNWKKMMGEQDDPGDSTDFLVPQIDDPPGFANGSLFDHMSIPPGVAGLELSALPLRAYQKIWNEWFRDENLQDSLVELKDDGPDDYAQYQLQRRGKRHDYFTSCLPFAQKGTPVELPLGSTAPVVPDTTNLPTFSFDGGDHSLNAEGVGPTQNNARFGGAGNTGPETGVRWADPSLEVDLSSATAATINSIREAFQLQKLFERDARGGTRYVESIKAHFGVVSPDFRQQRSEYLGGGTQQINFHPVAQTEVNTQFTEGLGSLGAFAESSSSNHGFVKSFTEHCTLIGMVSVRADLNYQQGVSRMWSRRTRFDFAYPVFAGLGEQAVLNKEIFADGSASDDLVFGYQERYAEYRYKASEICGEFRSSFATPLDAWHLAQDFATLPTLSATFIEDNPPVDRILTVAGAPQVLFDSWFTALVARPLPVYGVPGNMDRL